MTKSAKSGRKPIILLPNVNAYLRSLDNLGKSFYSLNSVSFDLNSLFLYTDRKFTASQFRSLQLAMLLSTQSVAPLFPESEVA